MNNVNKHIKITKDLLIKAKAGDQPEQMLIVDALTPKIKYEAAKYSGPYDEDFEDLVPAAIYLSTITSNNTTKTTKLMFLK